MHVWFVAISSVILGYYFFFSLQWLSTLFKIKAHSFLGMLIMQIIYNVLASLHPSGRGIFKLSLFLSFSYDHFSHWDILPRTARQEEFFQSESSFSVTGEEEVSFSSLSHTKLEFSISLNYISTERIHFLSHV